MSVESSLDAAIERLHDARNAAGLGTALMIDSEIESLRNLRSRVSNINDDDSDI